MNEREDNFARLIRAGMADGARPRPALREQMLRRLQSELRAEQTPAEAVFEPASRLARAEVKISNKKETFMNKLFTRWGFGLSAAAAAAAVVIIIFLGLPEKAQGKAAEVVAKGARALAKVSSVHFQGQMRTAPQDNFSAIMPEQEPVKIEVWKQFGPDLKWRIEKPGRVAVMDGQSTTLFIRPDYAVKGPPLRSAFDTDLFHHMADFSEALTHELNAIKAHGWPVSLSEETTSEGTTKSIVTVQAKSGLSDSDYLKNKFFMTADTRRVYVFDNQTELLESVRVYLSGASGEQLVFELNQIDFNQAIDPEVFHIQLPANVKWEQRMQILPDNAKYAAMTPEQAARTFLEACGRGDWTEAEKFMSPITDSFKKDRGGLQLVSLGKSFTSALSFISRAYFVPYEVHYKDGTVVKHNLALKKDGRTGRWFVDGGI